MAFTLSAAAQRFARAVVSGAVTFSVLVSLTACGAPLAPRALEVGDALGVDGIRLVGISAYDIPLSYAWGFHFEPPRFWLMNPRDAVAVSVRAGLRTLDAYPCFRGDADDVGSPTTLVVDGVAWAIQVAFDGGPVIQASFQESPGLVLIADAVRQPSGAVRFRPADVERARRALSFVVAVDDFEDVRQLLDRVARGTPFSVTVRVVLSLAEHAAFGDCATMIAELSSDGTTVWMAADRR